MDTAKTAKTVYLPTAAGFLSGSPGLITLAVVFSFLVRDW
jgi:hypothetical protein